MPEDRRLHVVRPGLLTTIQDLGRFGFQRFGMPVGGAMDPLALRLANRLVGNRDGAAALEVTVTGPELAFEGDAVIAITGGDLSPSLDGAPVPAWTAVHAGNGARLTFGVRRQGSRSYVAVAGGLDVPEVLGSRSTHLGSRTGGLRGRALSRDDVLVVGRPAAASAGSRGRAVPNDLRPDYTSTPTLRVIPGPQADRFSRQTLETLITSRWVISPHSDRMGYRLEGPPLDHLTSPDIVSDATPLGAVQVPASRQPILLMADRQPTGGYPKLAVVITADLPLAGQLLPGDTIRFAEASIDDAHDALRRQWRELDRAIPPVGSPRSDA